MIAVWMVLLLSTALLAAQGEADGVLGVWRKHSTAGTAALARAEYREAEDEFKSALEIAEKLGGSHLVISWNSMATLYAATERYSDAEWTYVRALSLAQHSGQSSPRNTANILSNYAV